MSRIDEAMRQAGIKPAGEVQPELPALEAFPVGPEPVTTAPPPSAVPPRRAAAPVESRPAEPSAAPATASQPRERKFAVAEKLVIHETATPGCVEQYRRVAATLHQLQEERGLRVVMIASAQVGEGKTLTAANLALTLSESYKRRVLLIDADLRRPSLSELFRVQRVAGLSESLQNGGGPLRVFELSEWLSLLPSGRPTTDPMAGLTSGRMQQIIAEAARTYDWVILDTPPAALQPDAHLLAPMVEGTVLVIGAGIAPSPVVQSAIDTIGRDKILGVILNRVDPSSFNETEYYRYYYAEPVPAFSGGTPPKPRGQA
jgi:capsular exopolysaccharide synthesis family protein